MPMYMTKPKSMPPEMMEVAEEADTVFEDVLPRPEKPYNPKTVTSLAKAVTDVATKLFGMRDLKSESYPGPVESLDPRLAQMLMMIAEAAKDYGNPLPVEPMSLATDADLIAVTSHITGLLRDPEFRAFLAAEAADEGMEEGGEEAETEETAPFDFAARMRR